MTIVTVGIDLAKNVFAVHGVDEFGKPALVRPEVPRAKLVELIANLPACLIGMEACSRAHHWAREFVKFGHTVRMMAAYGIRRKVAQSENAQARNSSYRDTRSDSLQRLVRRRARARKERHLH